MFLTKIRTALSLGIINILRVFVYRIGVKTGINPVRRLVADSPNGVFFKPYTGPIYNLSAVKTWQEEFQVFSYWNCPIQSQPPHWHTNPLTGQTVLNANKSWWEIPDFDSAVGDIKQIWELSRFDWVLAFAQHAATGNTEAIAKLNLWLNDWSTNNPPYQGPNWKCGQEASIRVMHLAMAALIIDEVDVSTSPLIDLVHLHLQRIAPTIQYAIAQDNNHGTSEAAALFIGGSWLARNGIQEGIAWQSMGRKWLENRAAKLILEDGSFSQYSLNYHRVMLDTFCMAELWRKKLDLPRFTSIWYERAKAATNFLYTMINVENGDGPNLGANDGARLLQLTDSDYRDFRPTVQLAMALFADARAFASKGTWDLPLYWFNIELPQTLAAPQQSANFDLGGFAVLRRGSAMAMLRYPKFKFRPSQADVLHLDLWLGHRNLLRDAGTYSYNTEEHWLNYFPGTISHNTVQFDERDQMPRLSRFLFGNWLKTSRQQPLQETDGKVSFAAAYQDAHKAYHQRKVSLTDTSLLVEDEVKGFNQKAVLRWRLGRGAWEVKENKVSNSEHQLTVHSSAPIIRFEIVEGWESRYYLEKTPSPVLEVEIQEAGTMTTEYKWVL